MKTTLLALIALLCLTACKPPVPPKPPQPPVAPEAPPAPIAFTINDLKEEDGNIMGCTTMLSRASGGADIFREDAVEENAKGYMRINGQLIEVHLFKNDRREDTSLRAFKDTTDSLYITEAAVVGAAHQESDSVDLKGFLTVTWKGAEQSFSFVGGTAC